MSSSDEESCLSPGLDLGWMDGLSESQPSEPGSSTTAGTPNGSTPMDEATSSPSPPTAPPELEAVTSAPQEASRLRATHWFLTWSRTPVDLTREEVLAHLQTIGEVRNAVIALENHQDGTPHLHAAVSFTKLIQVRISPLFNPFHLRNQTQKGRYLVVKPTRPGQSVKGAITATQNYCRKSDASALELNTGETNDVWTNTLALAATDSVEAAVQWLAQKRPRDVVLHLDAVERNLKKHREMVLAAPLTSRPLSDFPHAPTLPEWNVLMLGGRTGLGKTELAIALLPGAAFISQLDDLRTADLSRGVIFDDIEVGHLPFQGILNLTDYERPRSAYCRYMNAKIPARTRRIFTTNSLSVYDWICGARDNVKMPISPEKIEALTRRITFIEIITRLF